MYVKSKLHLNQDTMSQGCPLMALFGRNIRIIIRRIMLLTESGSTVCNIYLASGNTEKFL